MNTTHKLPWFLAGAWLLVVAAEPAKAQTKITFDQHIMAILRDKCLNCHSADKSRGGLDVSTFGKLMEGGSGGPVVKPGDVEGSRLFALVSHKEEPHMPPNAALMAKNYLDTIKAWIESGAPENAGSKVAAMAKKTEVATKAVTRARPATPPMPTARLRLDPILHTSRANAVTAMATSPWAPLAAVAAPKQVLLYDTNTLDLIGVLPFDHGQVNVLHFARSGEVLLAAGGHAGKSGKSILYDIKSGKVIADLGDEPDAILAADLSPDQSNVAVGGPGRIVRIYSTGDGSKVREIKKHTDWVTAIEYSPDGVLLATADRNGGLMVWEANTGREYFPLAGHKSAITDVCWRDDGNVLASVSEEGNAKFWEMEDGKLIRTIPVPGGQSVEFGHDNRLVATGRDLKTRLFDPNGVLQREFTGSPDLATKTAVTHDGARILTGDWTGSVLVWQASDGKKVGQLSTNPPSQAERLEAAKLDFAAKQRVVEIADGLFKEAQTQEQAVKSQFDAAQKNLAAAQAANGAANAAADTAKKSLATLEASVGTLAKEAVGAQLKVAAFTAAVNVIKSEAAKSPNDPVVAKAVADVQKTLDAANAESDRIKDDQQKQSAAIPAAKQQSEAAAKAASDKANQLKAAQANAAAAEKTAQVAPVKTAAAKAVLDRATADRDAAKATLERLQK